MLGIWDRHIGNYLGPYSTLRTKLFVLLFLCFSTPQVASRPASCNLQGFRASTEFRRCRGPQAKQWCTVHSHSTISSEGLGNSPAAEKGSGKSCVLLGPSATVFVVSDSLYMARISAVPVPCALALRALRRRRKSESLPCLQNSLKSTL